MVSKKTPSKLHTSTWDKSSDILSLEEILKHKEVIENMSDGFLAINKKWEYLYINEQAEKLIDAQRDEVIGKNIWKRYPNLKGTKFEIEYKKAVKNKLTVEFNEYNNRVKRFFHVRAVPIHEGLLVYFYDVSREKKIEETLEYQRLLLEAQKEASPEGILIVSEKGNIFSYNKRFANMWNLPTTIMNSKLDELALKSAREQLVDPGGFIKRVGQIYKSRKKSHDMLHFKNGSVFDRHGSPIIGKNGTYYGYVWFFLDITQREKAIERLAEMDQRKDEFINMASHELRTPITSLSLYTELLKKKLQTREDKELYDHVVKMDNQIWRMSDLIKDMLDLSRIQTGKLIYRDELFSINELVEEVCESMQKTTEHQRIKTELLKDVKVKADRNRISQVLINLISNAIKYSPRNAEVLVNVVHDKKFVTISVQDFGMGISKKHQQRIFERFYQVVEPTSKTFPGLGIGLHISSEIVKRHKGDIWVESTKGKGSVFSFSLPIRLK